MNDKADSAPAGAEETLARLNDAIEAHRELASYRRECEEQVQRNTSTSGLTEALKPCRVCGQTPWGVFGPCPELGSCWVECHGPDENTPCGNWHFQGTRAETVAAWNRRVSTTPPAAGLTDEQIEAGFRSFDWSSVPHPFRGSVGFERGARWAEARFRAALASASTAPSATGPRYSFDDLPDDYEVN